MICAHEIKNNTITLDEQMRCRLCGKIYAGQPYPQGTTSTFKYTACGKKHRGNACTLAKDHDGACA